MATSGHSAPRRHPALAWRWANGVLAALFTLLAGLVYVAEVSAKSRDGKTSRSSSYFEAQMREAARAAQAQMERQRQEQQRAQQAAMRAAQEAQKAAERNAQAEIQRQMRQAQEQAMRQADKARQAAQREAERAAQRAPKTNAWAPQAKTPAVRTPQRGDQKVARDPDDKVAPVRAPDRKNGDDDADLGDVDLGLSQAEQRARAIERMSRRALVQAQREQEALRAREQARAARIRERTLKRLDASRAGGHGDPRVESRGDGAASEKPARIEKNKTEPPAIVPVAIGEADEPAARFAQRRAKWLDEHQRQSSHLGMGRGVLKDALGKRNPDKEDASPGGDTASGSGPENAFGKTAAGGRTTGSGDAKAAISPRRASFPGKNLGGEMPADLFQKEREEELVVTEISPVDLETAKEHGFDISAPTVLPGSGKKVQRIRGPAGVSRFEVERELHKVLPFLSVTPNYAYNIFIGSLGETDAASGMGQGIDRRKISPASAQPCPNNTCFGGELIKWKTTLGSCAKDVRIGLIDTSFDVEHPAFRDIKAEQGEFLDGKAPSPYDWHGTAVLSLLAGDPHSGTPGLVPDATFLLATAFRSDAAGNASTDTVRLLAALAWLEELDVDIVNMSFSGPQDPAFARAIERMSKKGIVFIAAAGNMGPTAAPSYPAAYPDVIAVTAVNRNGNNYRSANRGTYIDVSAPGVDILTALPDATQGYRTGTSFAVPFVTAILATQDREIAPGAAKRQLLAQLSTQDLGPPGHDPIYGAGLALAPQRCTGRSDAVAEGLAPALESWSAQTTLIRAGAGFAP